MKAVLKHIEHVKGKPHHIRKQVALAAAFVGSALVALVWFGASVATGAFAIQGSNFADATRSDTFVVATTSEDGTSGLAGAAAGVSSGADAPAHIEIVDTSSNNQPKKQAEQTTIPF